jgi:hypothetical protein
LAKYTKNPKASERIAIIPTDEERLKLIVVPLSVVDAEIAMSQSMMKVVREVLSNIEVLDRADDTRQVSLLIPSFAQELVFDVPELVGT